MAKFKITQKTTVAELKEQFRNEVGGVLRIYDGRSEASEDVTLVSIGARQGELECRKSRTVGKFEEAFQQELNLKVKVCTKGNNVKVLDGITLEVAGKLPWKVSKEKMEAYLSYKKEEKEKVNDLAVAEDEYILFVTSRAGNIVKPFDSSEAIILKEGENKIFLNEYPQIRNGFQLDAMKSKQITSIDFSHVSRLKIKSMEKMFEGTFSLKHLDLTHLDTSEVVNVADAFSCSAIETIDMSGLDLSKIEDPKYSGLFSWTGEKLTQITMNGCNAKTIENVKLALTAGSLATVEIISDSIKDLCPSEFEDFTQEKLEEAAYRGDIVVVMEKCDAHNAQELYEKVYEGDTQSVITYIDGEFHYVTDEWPESVEDLENQNIDYDNLYIIYDCPNEFSELDLQQSDNYGIYLPASSWSYYQNEDEEREYPDDDNYPCFVVTEALTGDDTGHVWGGVYFYAHMIFICGNKIIAECN